MVIIIFKRFTLLGWLKINSIILIINSYSQWFISTGLILVPNGEPIGYALGDQEPTNRTVVPSVLGPRSTALEDAGSNYHPWGVFFTILGTVFLDFDADACQSPARAYLLDVTVPGDNCFLKSIIKHYDCVSIFVISTIKRWTT